MNSDADNAYTSFQSSKPRISQKGMKHKSNKALPNLVPLEPLDVEACSTLSDVLESMDKTSFGGRSVGRAWAILKKISQDPDCGLILTVSGAMTVAKLGRVMGSLISNSIVHVVITTGAVVTHSLVEESGMLHYQAPIGISDEELSELKLNRIYDSIEPESNLESLEEATRESFAQLNPEYRYGSFELIKSLSAEVLKKREKRGLLGAALSKGVNIFVPALTDSELGLFLYRFNKDSTENSRSPVLFDPLKDLDEYARWMRSKKRLAFLTLGGGVPRNWAQQMLPFLNAYPASSGNDSLPLVSAAVRICPDQPGLGHLSGCTYSEGISWGKFSAESKENFVEINCDATIIFPILAKALIDFIKTKP